jgi:hypothetical protein
MIWPSINFYPCLWPQVSYQTSLILILNTFFAFWRVYILFHDNWQVRNKKNFTASDQDLISETIFFSSDFPLTKSKSHESELGNRLHPVNISGTSQATTPSSETSTSNVTKTSHNDDGTGKDEYFVLKNDN